jgi:hypothetical protein
MRRSERAPAADVGREADLPHALDVTRPRAEADAVQHVRDRPGVRLRGNRVVALGRDLTDGD